MTRLSLLLAGGILIATPAIADPVGEAEIREVLEVLASDEFEGREPGTEGGRKTLHYLATQWHEAGLVGGARDGGWYEPVMLTSRTPAVIPLAPRVGDEELALDGNAALILSSEEAVELEGLPIRFAGYGLTTDGGVPTGIEGAIAVMLASPPPFDVTSPVLADPFARVRNLMDAGAAAVVAVLPVNLPYTAVLGNLSRGSQQLVGGAGAGGMPSGAVLGIMDGGYFSSMAERNGETAERWLEAAGAEGFSSVDTGMVADVAGQAGGAARSVYFNVVGKLPGTNSTLGAIAVGGHWDGYGICRPEGAEDRICNGAVDNASGLAAISALADDLVEDGPYLRDILVVGFTMEEKGLWGARGMAANPPQDIALLFNIDTIATTDNVDRIAVIGRGVYAMDDAVMAAVEPMGYQLNDTNKYSSRQDGHAFVQAGIPAYVVSVNWGDMESFDAYVESGPYHQPGDDMSEVKLGATVADANVNLALLQHFANKEALPEGKFDEQED